MKLTMEQQYVSSVLHTNSIAVDAPATLGDRESAGMALAPKLGYSFRVQHQKLIKCIFNSYNLSTLKRRK